MGYYTNFKLQVSDKDHDIDSAIHPEWEESTMYGNSLSLQDLITKRADSMKWYDHKEDMLEVSKKYPKYLFILDGDGEEAGDLWREFYKNGKTYKWTPKIERPSFNPAKLE